MRGHVKQERTGIGPSVSSTAVNEDHPIMSAIIGGPLNEPNWISRQFRFNLSVLHFASLPPLPFPSPTPISLPPLSLPPPPHWQCYSIWVWAFSNTNFQREGPGSKELPGCESGHAVRQESLALMPPSLSTSDPSGFYLFPSEVSSGRLLRCASGRRHSALWYDIAPGFNGRALCFVNKQLRV